MRILTLFFLLVFSFSSYAFQCRNGDTLTPNGSVVNIYVPVEDNIDVNSLGENIFANVGDHFECYNDYGWGIDYLDIIEIIPGPSIESAGLSSGVYIHDVKYYSDTPLGNGVQAFELSDKTWKPLDVDMFFDTTQAVGPLVIISAGQPILTLKMHFHSTNDDHEEWFTWVFRASNDMFLASGNCMINDNEPIEIDFGEVSKNKISTVGHQTFYQIDEELNYDCENNSVNENIKVSLFADIAPFSSTAFPTKEISGLGVEMYHDGKVIAPREGFNSNIYNGRGRDTVTFTLVKTPNPGPSDLQEGDFSASASLVMSTP